MSCSKVNARENKSDANNATENTMPPLHIEYALEVLYADVLVQPMYISATKESYINWHLQFEFRGGLVFLKLLLPIIASERWKNASNRLPLRDAQTRLGQSCHPSDYHHSKYQYRREQKPSSNSRRSEYGKF